MAKQKLYICRIDKHGRECWYLDSRLASRLIRVSADEAKLAISTGEGRKAN